MTETQRHGVEPAAEVWTKTSTHSPHVSAMTTLPCKQWRHNGALTWRGWSDLQHPGHSHKPEYQSTASLFINPPIAAKGPGGPVDVSVILRCWMQGCNQQYARTLNTYCEAWAEAADRTVTTVQDELANRLCAKNNRQGIEITIWINQRYSQ